MSTTNPRVEKSKPAIAVYGASGHTGRFVVNELAARGFVPIAVARDETKLAAGGALAEGTVKRVASIEDQASLGHALAGAAAVINCAGPFLDTADAVITAALRAKIHYLDVTAEQESARRTYEKFAVPAREAGVVVLPGMGFYGGLGDLLATAAMGDWTRADAIDLAIALDSWSPTLGTRVTGRRNTFRRVIVSGGALEPLPDPAPTRSWSFAAPFGVQEMVALPFAEVILIARHLRASDIRNYLNTSSLRGLRDPATPPPVAADASGRSAQIFRMEATVRRDGRVRRAAVSGSDIYACSAPLVVEAAERVLGDGAARRGVFAPGELFDPRDFLRALGAELDAGEPIGAGEGG